MELVNEDDKTLKEALILATKDAECRNLYFVTQLVLGGKEGKGQGNQQRYENETQNQWGNGKTKKDKGKGKGNDKGGGKKRKIKGGWQYDDEQTRDFKNRKAGKGAGKQTYTSDNEPICFQFNNGLTCPADCPKVHKCQFGSCGKKHPIKDCEAAKKAGVVP